MASETRHDPLHDHLLTPENSAFVIIDYQPIQVASIRSMPQQELMFNIVSSVKAALNYKLPIVHSTVNVETGANKPPIPEGSCSDRLPQADHDRTLDRGLLGISGARRLAGRL